MRNGTRLRGFDFARQRKDPTVVAGCKRPPDRSLPRRLRRAYLEQTRVSARAPARSSRRQPCGRLGAQLASTSDELGTAGAGRGFVGLLCRSLTRHRRRAAPEAEHDGRVTIGRPLKNSPMDIVRPRP